MGPLFGHWSGLSYLENAAEVLLARRCDGIMAES